MLTRPVPSGSEGGAEAVGRMPWRTLISAVHPNPTVKINHGATFLVTDQHGAVPLEVLDKRIREWVVGVKR